MSDYAGDLVIACGVRNKDMIVASLQPVDKVDVWSANVRLILESSKHELSFFSQDFAEVS